MTTLKSLKATVQKLIDEAEAEAAEYRPATIVVEAGQSPLEACIEQGINYFEATLNSDTRWLHPFTPEVKERLFLVEETNSEIYDELVRQRAFYEQWHPTDANQKLHKKHELNRVGEGLMDIHLGQHIETLHVHVYLK